MSPENEILSFIAKKHVISYEELKRELGHLRKEVLQDAINKLKIEGLICSSNLLSPTTLVITTKGSNSLKS